MFPELSSISNFQYLGHYTSQGSSNDTSQEELRTGIYVDVNPTKEMFKKYYPVDENTPRRVLDGIGYGMALNGAQRVANGILSSLVGEEPRPNSSTARLPERVSMHSFPQKGILRAGVVTILAPIIEEIVFRGLYADHQKERTGVCLESDDSPSGRSLSQKAKDYAENSAIFTAAHYDFRSSLMSFARRVPLLFLSGLALSQLADSKGTLIEGSVAHGVSNMLTLAIRGKKG